jgi:hypothetical protein
MWSRTTTQALPCLTCAVAEAGQEGLDMSYVPIGAIMFELMSYGSKGISIWPSSVPPAPLKHRSVAG